MTPHLVTDPLEHTGHLLRRVQQVHNAAWNRFVSLEVTSTQYAALACLQRTPKMSQTELGLRLDLDRATITELIRRLEARDLIKREPDANDHRRKLLTLTDEGENTVRAIEPRVHGIESIVCGGLVGRERELFRASLLNVLARAREVGLLSESKPSETPAQSS